jgi:murein L,D-transpeptidase YafK
MRRWIPLSLCLAVMMISIPADARDIPTSARSREAVHQIRPSLERALKANGFEWGAPVFIRIFKAEKCLELWLYDGRHFRLFKRFDICTYGGKGVGPKNQVGDGRAPEGFYYAAPAQLNPHSKYYLAFNLGYPNAYDRWHGRTGSALMVHGACVSIGCFAMTNARMAQIYTLVDASLRKGQPFFRVHIFPFRMTDQAINGHARPVAVDTRNQAQCINFWKNLKQGYDYFERHNRPPNVAVQNGRYVFQADH